MKSVHMFRLLLSLTLLSSISQAQQITPHVINSGGGSALVSGNIVEWNLGETIVSTLPSSSGVGITSGQLQPMDIIIQVEEVATSNVTIFPVPTLNTLNIRAEQNIHQVRVFDSTGRLVIEDHPYQMIFQIDVASLAAGVYQLVLIHSTDHIIFTKSFTKAN